MIRSDGAACPNPPWTGDTYTVGSFTAYAGCGKISVLAPGTPGCIPVACSVSGGGNAPVPAPTPLGDRYTRKVADWRYNCYHDYTSPPSSPSVLWASPALTVGNQQDIDPCEDADGTNDYIYKLIQEVKPSGLPDPTSYELWSAQAYGFNVGGTVIHNGDVVVDGNLQISGGNVTINGNAVFNGNVRITSTGSLTINAPSDEPWAFFRGGVLRKGGQGSLYINNTMLYVSKDSGVELTGGGSGNLTWTAPVSGPFEALALWSDSDSVHSFAGQAALNLEGIFFMPWARVTYQGNGEMQQTNAQWIAWRVSVGGNGALRIAPPVGNALNFRDHMTILIR